MGLFDELTSSVTSFFSSSNAATLPEASAAPAASVSPYSPAQMLSPHYSIGNLIQTSQPLSQPNMPSTAQEIQNLTLLADTLEFLESRIGPFNILSGFRTKELQDRLAAIGEPVATGKSYHELGLAVDIYPTTMSIADFFGRMLADEDVRAHFIEIAIKPSQNSLHLAVKTVNDTRETKVSGLNSENKYAKLNADEIARYIEPFMPSPEMAYDYAAARLVTYNRTPLILGAAALAGVALYLIFQNRRSLRQPSHPN